MNQKVRKSKVKARTDVRGLTNGLDQLQISKKANTNHRSLQEKDYFCFYIA